jgi:hypothetical protein
MHRAKPNRSPPGSSVRLIPEASCLPNYSGNGSRFAVFGLRRRSKSGIILTEAPLLVGCSGVREMSEANKPAAVRDDALRVHTTQRRPWSTPTVTVSHLRDARAGVGVGSDGTDTTPGGFVYHYGS